VPLISCSLPFTLTLSWLPLPSLSWGASTSVKHYVSCQGRVQRVGVGVGATNFSLDDFIPRHLQKNLSPRPVQSSLEDTQPTAVHHQYSAQSLQYNSNTNESPPGEDILQTPKRERIWIRYDGIGPTDEEGMPYASRSSVNKPREWYKSMFKVLHRLSDSEDSESEDEHLRIPDNQREERDSFTSNVSNKIQPYSKSSPPSNQLPEAQRSASLPRNVPNSAPHSFHGVSQKSNAFSKERSFAQNSDSSEPQRKVEQTTYFVQTSLENKLPNTKSDRRISSGSSSEDKSPLSTSSIDPRQYRRSTSRVLDQLEADGGRDEVDRARPHHAQNHNDLKEISKAIVKFNFEAQSPKELSLQKGSTVSILKRVLPPGHYTPKPACQLSAISLYDFKGESDAELSLRKGQRVLIARRVGGNWFEGQVEGSSRFGLFPASYVQVIGDPTQEQKGTPRTRGISQNNSQEQTSRIESASLRKPSITTKMPEVLGTQFRVLYDFTPNNSDELHLIAGDIITVTQNCDDGWYVGVCWRTQEFGTFTGNFVVPQPMT
uniref:Uncharacterized protein n=1 Tax=Leptobrachium leishanense TaxID=445787 RepID=A0A8C5QK11_9ANUR